MKPLLLTLLLSASFVVAQDNKPAAGASEKSKHAKGEITIQGCVARASGDYTLMKFDPAVTYQLQATGKIRLRNYLGQRVEVTGKESPTLSTSSDFLTKTGSASPETITISSIRTLDKECGAR
jgi:hypothetical protein